MRTTDWRSLIACLIVVALTVATERLDRQRFDRHTLWMRLAQLTVYPTFWCSSQGMMIEISQYPDGMSSQPEGFIKIADRKHYVDTLLSTYTEDWEWLWYCATWFDGGCRHPRTARPWNVDSALFLCSGSESLLRDGDGLDPFWTNYYCS